MNWVDPFGLSCKEGTDKGEMVVDQAWLDETFGDQGIKPVAVLPVEWLVEGIADAAEQLATMLDTGPTLAGAAAMAVSLIPGKVDKALEPVVGKLDKLDGVTNTATQAVKKAVNRKTPEDFPEFKSMNHKKAAAGEYNANELMKEKGYTPLGNTDGKYKPGETGIDGIYHDAGPPPKTVITEAKYNKARLGKTNDGKQMSNKWLNEKRLEKAGLSQKEQRKILRSLNSNDGSVKKLLIRNKLDGSLLVKILDKDAKIIGKALGL